MTTGSIGWPRVRPVVVAEVVAGLSARLQKRLDGAAAKLAERPVTGSGDEWRVEVDEETVLVLRAPGGVLTDPSDVQCGCLLAPACVHRAAAVTLCPLAGAEDDPEQAEADEPVVAPAASVAPTERTADDDALTPAEQAAARHLHHAASAALAAGTSGAGAVAQAELLRAAHVARAAGLYRPAAVAVAVVTRIRSARSGAPDHRLAELMADLRELLTLTRRLTADPATGPASATARVPVAELRGTARQAYGDAGGLRLYGLFAEPVLTATHAGVLSWAVDAAGRLSTVAEVLPYADADAAAAQAVGAGDRAVRLGDTSLSHREFTRAGLAVQGATRSASGRLGAGAAVRAVRATGAAWTAEPVARLWAEPVSVQVERALAAQAVPYEARPAGSDLLFLDVTLLGPANGDPANGGQTTDGQRPDGRTSAAAAATPGGAQCLLARCGEDGPVVALRAAHDHPGLAHRANLALLAAAPGLRLRVIGRLERAARPALRLLAIGTAAAEAGAPADSPTLALPADRAGRVHLGLERLQAADVPATAVAPTPLDVPAHPLDPPVHLLGRRIEQAVTSGRSALTPGTSTTATDGARLREAGLPTAADLLDALRTAATDHRRDVFGRVIPDDHSTFTTAWLAAAHYTEALATALCQAAWTPPGARA
ncbi:hypothetical protein PUR71_32670 [Streptomyces sp. SP17BM10]|uniref:hypothetical protein n=1 Tax=Streptomyces sp. SP17BM10 TaxID=3002530 RepID=UPI002E78C989|nr:hypothetical protein [Streptomyces sp. SP17BM10]MEE1787626.1 hypothetical protein [Streptomyces sp. SP17BM10]